MNAGNGTGKREQNDRPPRSRKICNRISRHFSSQIRFIDTGLHRGLLSANFPRTHYRVLARAPYCPRSGRTLSWRGPSSYFFSSCLYILFSFFFSTRWGTRGSSVRGERGDNWPWRVNALLCVFAARYRCRAAAYPMYIPCYNSLCGLRMTTISFSLSNLVRLTFSLPFAKKNRVPVRERERLPLLTFRFHAASGWRTARFFSPDPARPRGACPLLRGPRADCGELWLRLNNFNIIVHPASVSIQTDGARNIQRRWSYDQLALTMEGNKLQKTYGAKREVERSLERMDYGRRRRPSESASGCDEPRRKWRVREE